MIFDKFIIKDSAYKATDISNFVNLDDHGVGVTQNSKFIFYNDGDRIRVYDRICDHNRGRLSVSGEVAKCPLHNWIFDPKSGEYTNNHCTKKPLLDVRLIELDSSLMEIKTKTMNLRPYDFERDKLVKCEFLNHACLYFETEDLRFATDPWLVGSAFQNGWWLTKSSPNDVFEKLNKCDFIYISHNHPDHLHAETLAHVRSDMTFFVPNFSSGSTERVLRQLGFENIHKADFGKTYTDFVGEVSLTILKSGDFRDDSGLFVQLGKFSALLTVDSNFIDFGRFPEDITLLASSFAGGASGFPLCFENYTESEKQIIAQRNCMAIRNMNLSNLAACKPKYFMPYAGFFHEAAPRDHYIKGLNVKNSPSDYESICQKAGVELLDVNAFPELLFSDDDVVKKPFSGSRFKEPDVSEIIIQRELEPALSIGQIEKYFSGCGFHDELVLDISLTNDSFSIESVGFSVVFDLSGKPIFKPARSGQLPGKRYLLLKVREFEFYDVLRNRRPWEDLSIGFQLRVYRNPNIYNSRFWDHFTNIYIADNVNLE